MFHGAFSFWLNKLLSVCVTGTEIPTRLIDASLFTDCLTLLSLPNKSGTWMHLDNEMFQATLTLIWHHNYSKLLEAFMLQAADWKLPGLNYTVRSDVCVLICFLSRPRVSVVPQTASCHTDPFALCELHVVFIWRRRAYQAAEHQLKAFRVLIMWTGFHILWYHSSKNANLCSSLARSPSSFHYYCHSKDPHSKLHPINADVSTFIPAEFNYCPPFLPPSLTLINPKPWECLFKSNF